MSGLSRAGVSAEEKCWRASRHNYKVRCRHTLRHKDIDEDVDADVDLDVDIDIDMTTKMRSETQTRIRLTTTTQGHT